MSIPGQASGKMETWQTFMDRVRSGNFDLASTVKAYEDCVAIQGTPREDVQARVSHAKKREETRRAIVALHDDLMSHMAEGSADDKKSSFFTECYNFTSSVERFKKGLDRSIKKEKKRLDANKKELDKIKTSTRLSDEERNDAMSQCEEVDNITREKERACSKIRDDMTNLVSQLRVQASSDVQATEQAMEEEEEAGLLGEGKSKKVPYILIIVLFLVAIILGAVKWYLWFTGGGK